MIMFNNWRWFKVLKAVHDLETSQKSFDEVSSNWTLWGIVPPPFFVFLIMCESCVFSTARIGYLDRTRPTFKSSHFQCMFTSLQYRSVFSCCSSFCHPTNGINWRTLSKVITSGSLNKKTWSSVSLAANSFNPLTLKHNLILVLVCYCLSLLEWSVIKYPTK